MYSYLLSYLFTFDLGQLYFYQTLNVKSNNSQELKKISACLSILNALPTVINYFQKQPSRGVLEKGILKICSKVAGEHPCRSTIVIKLQSNFIEIVIRHGCSPVNLLYIFRTPFPKNTSGWLLLYFSQRSLKNMIRSMIYTTKNLSFCFELLSISYSSKNNAQALKHS